MWYDSSMAQHPIEPALKEALAAVRFGRDVREQHARVSPKGSERREEDLDVALTRIKRAMVPLRSFLGSAPYKPQTEPHMEITYRVRQASQALQSERRKLWKMQARKR